MDAKLIQPYETYVQVVKAYSSRLRRAFCTRREQKLRFAQAIHPFGFKMHDLKFEAPKHVLKHLRYNDRITVRMTIGYAAKGTHQAIITSLALVCIRSIWREGQPSHSCEGHQIW